MNGDDLSAPQREDDASPPPYEAGSPYESELTGGFEDDFDEMSPPGESIRVLVICVLAWALPGLGHIACGRVLRGLVLGLVVLSLFIGGIALHGKVYRPEEGEPMTYLAAIGAAGVGLPYVGAHA
ncbi:MAG: hypothetical protein PVJ51_14020, partial [Acidobacteriota bacterium]